MDLIERIADYLNELDELSAEISKGFIGSGESFVIYPLTGSTVEREFFDGTKDMGINYEIAMKSKNTELISSTLWIVQNELEDVGNIESSDGSFDFSSIDITNKPYINQIDEQGWKVFLLNIRANVTVFKKTN